MRVSGFINNSVVNGIGIRDVLFLQGCEHHCKGCHNPQTWSTLHGVEADVSLVAERLRDNGNNVTISGGEPLLQYNELIQLLRILKEDNINIWLYTGFTLEEIPEHRLKVLADYVDVIVDGRFEEDKKDLTLRFRGSSNQRIIDLPKSVELGKIVLWEEE